MTALSFRMVILILFAAALSNAASPAAPRAESVTPAALIHWSNEARRAIVPPGPDGIFGSENYGTKFPGEAAVYMGIVHVAMYDATVALTGGYVPHTVSMEAPDGASPEAAIATAAHHVLVGLQPALGLTPAGQAALDAEYARFLAGIPDSVAKSEGIALGNEIAAGVLTSRHDDGRDRDPRIGDLRPPSSGAGVWEPAGTPLGLRMPGIRPLSLASAAQFRPDGPSAMLGPEYAEDFREVARLGSIASTDRNDEQTTAALFWTDHDLRQWNDALLRLVDQRDLDLAQAARMLAMTHVAGADAMIACFDAKYTYWFWRPHQAIPQGDVDGNDATPGEAAWRPLRPAPNFPEYPSAHACHSSAVAEALEAFFGTDRLPLRIDSRVTRTTRDYDRLHDVVKDVDWARVLAGFHFRNSDLEGAILGRRVARHVIANDFAPSP